MSEHSLCPELNANTLLVLEAQKIVRWAATPIEPGESIGAQINKASRELRLPRGVIWRAWYGRAGPEIYPTIYEARCQLLERRQAEQHRQASPWQLNGHQICIKKQSA